MRLKRYGFVSLAIGFLLAGWVGESVGQGATTGSIRGQIATEGGGTAPNVQVVARNVETGLTRGARTDQAGRYQIPLLPPGTYDVQVSGVGFGSAVARAVRVSAAETAPVNLTVATQAVALEGVTVTATGGAPRVDPSQGGVVETISSEQVENLPVAGRDFTDFLNLSPLVSPQPGVGTGGQFAIGGARTSGTNVQIDGTDANNVFFGENRGSSRTPFAFSLESIREFQLITNGFDVEYGNYQGGVVNAITRGGTNDFRGSVFGFFRNEALTGEDFLGQPAEEYNVQQFGLNLSGPLVRDRLHFFGSVDVQRKDQPIFALTPEASRIPQGTIDQFQSALQQLGFPNAESVIGQTTQAEDNLVVFGRLDWTIDDNHRLTLRQNYSDFKQTNDRISSNETLTRGGPFVNQSNSTVLELNSVFGANAFNTFRFQYSGEDRPRNPNQPGGYLPEIRIDDVAGTQDIFTGGDGIIFRNRLVEDKLQFIDNFTYRIGDHSLKIGTNNLLSNTTNEFFLFGNGSFTFRPSTNAQGRQVSAIENFLAGRPAQYSRNIRACPVPLARQPSGNLTCPELDVPIAEFSALEWSVYAQDDWQVTDRLLVTPGIRFGGTSFGDEPTASQAVSAAFQDPLVGEAARTDFVPDFSGISPRFAFTYDLGGDESSLVRGGVGLLIGRAPTVLVGNVFQTERPLLSVFCTGTSVPRFDLQELLAGDRGANNPAACASGAAPTGRPEYTLFSRTFELPKTLKANLGFETLLTERTKFGVDFIYSSTEDNFTVRDINLRPRQFTLATENRPVFVPALNYAPTSAASTPRLANSGFNRVFLNTAEGEARSYNVSVELDHQVGERLDLGLRYGYSNAYDNSSFSCCTSNEGFNEPTPGDPNFLGDPGDEINGNWGPSDFERRHTFVANFIWDGPLGIRTSGIFRSQSGTPWTPLVDDDINGDGIAGNDRAYIGSELQFASAEDQATFNTLVEQFECLSDQQGRIATRNSCRNPWFHSLDLRLSKEISTFAGQRAEILVDAFNVLNGLNPDWGRFTGVFGSNEELLNATRFDRATSRVTYTVNEEFGQTEPVGFDPFQFQLQLGVRYRF